MANYKIKKDKATKTVWKRLKNRKSSVIEPAWTIKSPSGAYHGWFDKRTEAVKNWCRDTGQTWIHRKYVGDRAVRVIMTIKEI